MSYISEVADHLVARSVCESIVGPEVYTVIADWEKKGIPVAVVIDAVNEVSEQGGTVESLNELVNNSFRAWLQTKDA